MCTGSGVGMVLDAELVPLEAPVKTLIDAGTLSLLDVLSGGDDYQVLFTVADKKHATFLDAVNIMNLPPVTRIGHVTELIGEFIVRDAGGQPMMFETTGHDHF